MLRFSKLLIRKVLRERGVLTRDNTPVGRPVEIQSGIERTIQSSPRIGGLHHRYNLAA